MISATHRGLTKMSHNDIIDQNVTSNVSPVKYDLEEIQRRMDAKPIANPDIARRELLRQKSLERDTWQHEEAQAIINKLKRLFA